MSRSSIVVLLLLLPLGCDPSARSESRVVGAVAVDHRSREHETCARSADCAEPLRCFDGTCRRVEGSVVGDLHAAVGDRRMAEGDPAAAAEAFGQAVARYEADKIEVPPDLLCAQGRAMARERGVPMRRYELAARLLHRCLLGAPAGSSLRDRALAELAGLLEHGLDPAHLARSGPADAYLTRQPDAPDQDQLAITVAVQSRSRASTFKRFVKYLEDSPEVRAALLDCWKGNFQQTRSERMELTLPFRYGYTLDQHEDFSHSWIKVADAATPADESAAEAAACARARLDPLVEAEGRKMGAETRWDAAATFTVAPR
jgi:hypothetical protein